MVDLCSRTYGLLLLEISHQTREQAVNHSTFSIPLMLPFICFVLIEPLREFLEILPKGPGKN